METWLPVAFTVGFVFGMALMGWLMQDYLDHEPGEGTAHEATSVWVRSTEAPSMEARPVGPPLAAIREDRAPEWRRTCKHGIARCYHCPSCGQ